MYDLIVVGGGRSGTAAAVAAARQGLKVLIVEKSGCLGGAACNALVNPFMPYKVKVGGEIKNISDGFFMEIINALAEMDGMHQNGITFNEELLKVYLDRVTIEEGIDVFFHAFLCGVEKNGDKIEGVKVVSKSGEEILHAKYFIDTTGDADLAAYAGCPYELGRKEDGLCQPMTLCFRMAGVDVAEFYEHFPEVQALYKQFKAEGKINNPREDVLKFKNCADGVLHFNSTRIVRKNPTNAHDVSAAEREARAQMYELYTFLKENFDFCRNGVLLSSASEIGVRESRMIRGEYVLTVEDLKALTRFEDSIAACNYDIDIHNPEGSGTSHYYFGDGEYYTIPYRSLVPKGADNLLVAGRCISSTHEAQASYRIMPVCCTLGEAAGVAAAVACKSGTEKMKNVNVKCVQDILRANGAFI